MTLFLKNLTDPVIFLILLLLGGFIIFAVIALGVYAWKASSTSLDEAHKIVSRSKDDIPLLCGLILADVVMWIFVKPYADAALPPNTFLYILLGINSFFLYYISTGYLAVRRAKKRIKALQSQAFTHPQAFSYQVVGEETHMDRKRLRNISLIFWLGFLVLIPAGEIISMKSIPNPTLAQYIGIPMVILGAACICFAVFQSRRRR